MTRFALVAVVALAATGCHRPAATLGAAPMPAAPAVVAAAPAERLAPGPRQERVAGTASAGNPWGLVYNVDDWIESSPPRTASLIAYVNGGGTLTDHVYQNGWDGFTFTAPPDKDIHIKQISGYIEDPMAYGDVTSFFGGAAQGPYGSDWSQKVVYNGLVVIDGAWFNGGTGMGSVAAASGNDANMQGNVAGRFLKVTAAFPGAVDVVIGAGRAVLVQVPLPGPDFQCKAVGFTLLSGEAVAPAGAAEAK